MDPRRSQNVGQVWFPPAAAACGERDIVRSKEEQTAFSRRRPGKGTGCRKGLGGGAHNSEGRGLPCPSSGRGEWEWPGR
jgi:hypothetical protein